MEYNSVDEQVIQVKENNNIVGSIQKLILDEKVAQKLVLNMDLISSHSLKDLILDVELNKLGTSIIIGKFKISNIYNKKLKDKYIVLDTVSLKQI